MYTGYCGYLYPVKMIFQKEIYMLLTSSAEMSRPEQFHMSRPKRNICLTFSPACTGRPGLPLSAPDIAFLASPSRRL